MLKLLREGASQARAAVVLGCSPSTVSHHAKWLLQADALRVVGGASPRLYEAGPAVDSVQAALEGHERPESVRGHLHRGSYRWRVAGPPGTEPSWQQTWTASGVRFSILEFEVGGRTFRFKESRGRSCSLTIQPPDDWISHPGDVDSIEPARMRAVAAATRRFAKEYGYELVGRLEASAPTEVAFEAPGLAPVGRPGKGVWVDASPGRSEVEMRLDKSRDVVAAVVDLPAWRERLESRLDRLSETLDDVQGEIEANAGILERLVEIQRLQERNARRVTESLVRSAEPGPEVQ